MANIPTAQAADSVVTLTPSVMTYTNTAAPNTVYSGYSDTVVSKTQYATYLKFDTSKIASTATIVSAELQVNVNASQAKAPALWVASSDPSMTYSKMTYQSRPALLTGGVNPNESAIASSNKVITTKLTGLASSRPQPWLALRLGYTTAYSALHVSKQTPPVLRVSVRQASDIDQGPATNPGWGSDQSAVPLGEAGCDLYSGSATALAMRKQWDYWDVCGGSEVSASAEGLPAQPGGGDHVFRWHKPAGDSNVYQKLNLTLTKDNWPNGSSGPVPNSGSPADVSGIYTVSQYLPTSRFKLNPSHGWVILSEFKENYTDAGGTWHQDPAWWLGCHNFDGAPKCSMSPHSSPTFALAPYMDRWVTWQWRIYQGAKDTTGHGGRIELWADGKLLDTGYNSQQHVGSAAFSSLSKTQAFIWIAGQYSSNQTTNGVPDYMGSDLTSYVGRSTIAPLK